MTKTTTQWTSVEDARSFILSRITAITDNCRVPLRGALGGVLGEDISAPFNVPGYDF